MLSTADYSTFFEVESSGFRLISLRPGEGFRREQRSLFPTVFGMSVRPRKTGGAILLTRGVAHQALLPLYRAELPFHQSATPEARGYDLP